MRYDEALALDQQLGFFGDSDYWEAPWDRTGVIEADCFICHLDGYEYSVRAQHIKKLNFKWAATAGTLLGYVWGSVVEGQDPKVYYNREHFMADGRVHLPIVRPSDRHCLHCHDISSVQKRGSTWHQSYEHDVHTNQGISCTDCHANDIRHNFTKGDSSSQTVREDLDNTMLSCKECHEQKVLGAPDYTHDWLPALHLERISCEACHITSRPFTATQTVDTTRGEWRQLPYETMPEHFDSFLLGAMWGYVEGQFANNLVHLFDANTLAAAAGHPIAPGDPVRALYAEGGGAPLPEATFTAREFAEAEGGMASRDARVLLLNVLDTHFVEGQLEEDATTRDETSGAPASEFRGKVAAELPAFAVCVFRGVTYRYHLADLQTMDSQLQPKRPGATIAESKFSFAKYNGMIHSEGSQVAAYWVYQDDEHLRPVFIKDMKHAWDFLHDEEYRILFYPAKTKEEGTVTPAWPGIPVDPALVDNPYDSRFETDDAQQAAREAMVRRTALENELKQALVGKVVMHHAEDAYTPSIHDDTNDTIPEINTEEEMKLMAWAIQATMPRLAGRALYYIRGTSVFRVTCEPWQNPYEGDLIHAAARMAIPENAPFMRMDRYEEVEVPGPNSWDPPGKEWQRVENRIAPMLVASVEPVEVASVPGLEEFATRQRWTVSHGVEPGPMALGANGCTDCHSSDSHFYFGKVVTDPFREDATPGYTPMYALLGYDVPSLNLGIWRESVLKPLSPWLVLAVAVLILLHFVLVGAKGGSTPGEKTVKRFNVGERLGHLVSMTTVVFLAITGFCFLLAHNDPLGHWARPLHTWFGYVASGGVAFMILIWIIAMLPRKGDLKWLLKGGGYIVPLKEHLPAGKFNAGQKALFWTVAVTFVVLIVTGVIMGLNRGAHFPGQELLYTLHDVAGLGMIIMLMAHAYLASIVVPHSLNALFGGKVNRKWAEEHHPDWKIPPPEETGENAH
jgi:formate dehydrogenase gamma subunit